MKLATLGFCVLLLAAAGRLGGSASGDSQTDAVVDLAKFAEEVAVVERALARTAGFTRADLLARYGRSSAGSGRFDLAAAAYAMFLDEFGMSHPYSERIAMRLADYLFPFNYRQIDVVHTVAGPRLHPAWRMEFSPWPERLRQAVRVYGLAASITNDHRTKGAALLKLGWVYRVLDD